MPERIVVLSDGTRNSSAKVWRTNVWRTFEFLDLTSPEQVAMYDDGVGTSAFLPLALLGGAFGWGLKRNVIDLYKFICRNYNRDPQRAPPSKIYAFGFSRGAFTVRVLIGLILHSRPSTLSHRTRSPRARSIGVSCFSRRAISFDTSDRVDIPLNAGLPTLCLG